MIKLLIVLGAIYLAYRLFPARVFDFAVRMQRRQSGLTRKEVQVGDHRIVYLEGGHGTPLLLLHGFGAEKDHWTQIARFLTPGYRVIAPDLPGFGESSRVDSISYNLDAQLDRIAEFARALGLANFHLGGNSMGGYLAAMYAARAPEQVLSLWLLAPAGVAEAEESELLRLINRGDNLLILDSEDKAKRLVHLLFTKPPFVPAGFAAVWRERAMAVREFSAKIFSELFENPVLLDERVPGIATPALIVWGDDDRLLHVSGAAKLQAMLPNSELRIMPCMGHCPMLERPRETAADFLNFQGKGLP
ncbi:MAG: alpha/beta fold hydrolase [Gammaproteobacteria bacterium]|nr:alpha/beta fold hydrolase [Gammaproteobacteria bacterium]